MTADDLMIGERFSFPVDWFWGFLAVFHVPGSSVAGWLAAVTTIHVVGPGWCPCRRRRRRVPVGIRAGWGRPFRKR